MSEILKQIEEAAEYINQHIKLTPLIGVTLGSGLGNFVQSASNTIEILYKDIPHFPTCTVSGHDGKLVFGEVSSKPIAIMQGRFHLYEGYSPTQLALPTRVLSRVGIKTLILTNAAGGIADTMKPSDIMVITDQVNLTGTSPLIGPNVNELGTRFPSMSQLYSKNLNKKLLRILKKNNIDHSSGTYCGVTGPSFETAAEIKYMQTIGCSAVGMSTVLEAITAKHLGLELCGISCITNLGTGMDPSSIESHDTVKKNAQLAEKKFSQVIQELIAEI